MRLKSLFVVAVLTASCATLGLFGLKDPPDIDSCSLVWNGTLDASYAYCLSLNPRSNREYRVPADQVFKKKFVAMPAKHESEMQKYVEYLEAQAKRRCK